MNVSSIIYIHIVVIELKARQRNVIIANVDYRKVYDMITYTWINRCLSIFTIIINLRELV